MKRIILIALISLLCLTNTYGADDSIWWIGDNIRIVQKGRVDNKRTFNSIQAAIDSITDASFDKRYLVKVMPGYYDESIILKPYITVEGSGRENTIIRYYDENIHSIVILADNSEIKNLRIEGGGKFGVIGGRGKVKDITIFTGITNGIYGEIDVYNVEILASGIGIYIYAQGHEISGCKIMANVGIQFGAPRGLIENCFINSSSIGMDVWAPGNPEGIILRNNRIVIHVPLR